MPIVASGTLQLYPSQEKTRQGLKCVEVYLSLFPNSTQSRGELIESLVNSVGLTNPLHFCFNDHSKQDSWIIIIVIIPMYPHRLSPKSGPMAKGNERKDLVSVFLRFHLPSLSVETYWVYLVSYLKNTKAKQIWLRSLRFFLYMPAATRNQFCQDASKKVQAVADVYTRQHW